MIDAGVITGVSVSHKRASVEEIEAACGDSERAVTEELLAREGVREAFAVQTCNRAEAYVVTDDAADGRRALSEFAPAVREGAVVHMDHEESLRHLMRVAAGLESLVLGEDQILGQLNEALEEARAVGGLGEVLEDALLKAVHVGERAREETRINEGAVSLGSAAVRLAKRRIDLAGATALVVGAGEMGTLAARSLAASGVAEVLVANRTLPHAEHVACELDVPAEAVPLDAVGRVVDRADLVISATAAPDHVLVAEDLADAEDALVIDIAQPRDVAPEAAEREGLTVEDIDALRSVTDEARERRREAAAEVERLIDEEFQRLLASYKRKRADAAISRMYESAERVKERELEEAFSKLAAHGEFDDQQREIVADMADALVRQLLAAPTKSLREAAAEDDWTTIQTAMTLFNPRFEDSPAESAVPRGMPEGTAPDGDDAPAGIPADVDIDADAELPPEIAERLSED